MTDLLHILWVRRAGIVVLDMLVAAIAWLGAYWLRFNFSTIPEPFLNQAFHSLPLLLLMQAAIFAWFGVFRGVWRFTSVPDLVRILKAVFLGATLATVVLFAVYRLEQVPRSVPFFYFLLLLVMLTGTRLAYRWMKEESFVPVAGRRVLIVGAGEAGDLLARDMLRHRDAGYMPVAYVDDRPRRQGREVRGIPVRGGVEEIPRLVHVLRADLILLALPSASTRQMRRAVSFCEQAGVPFKTLPNLEELINGEVSVSGLRAVAIEDILGRDPVSLDWDAIRAGLAGRRVLVTGAGGSIGSELCRQLARLQPSQLILAENSEFNLYRIDSELSRVLPDCKVSACLADVADKARMEQLFVDYKPDVVFHAAAYKHVPLLEHQVREAVRNNVRGTRTVADLAAAHGCFEFVLISTDKAVNPTSVMGTTKRLAEIYCQNLDQHSTTRFITVRFGNVLDSAGSVVPLFREQISSGGPVTVTHEEMERYFMTIPEACQLIMQASVIGQGGEIFVLNMGEPVKIRDLAEQMIRLSGKVPEQDIEIKFIGLRPGEKLYEELFHCDEALKATSHKEILLAQHRTVDWQVLQDGVATMDSACDTLDEGVLLEQLQRFVPESRLTASASAQAKSIAH
ncbi:polysaccharide biosynthesis protein [Thiosocius teredinicola]|uniref:polysaccharide biosynthesis protein n=1 Tax=Thiosocius teredinicola TaxID=1973002 RepID=UPI002FE45BD3